MRVNLCFTDNFNISNLIDDIKSNKNYSQLNGFVESIIGTNNNKDRFTNSSVGSIKKDNVQPSI